MGRRYDKRAALTPGLQAVVLTNKPLAAPDPCCCRLLASVVRNCWSSLVVSLDDVLDEAPIAVNRF